MYEQNQGTPHILYAIDKLHRSCNKKIKIPSEAQATAGLHHTIKLKIGMAIELCAGNHDISDGLINGADARFMGCEINTKPPLIWVEFTLPTTSERTRYESQALYKPTTPQSWMPLHQVTKEF